MGELEDKLNQLLSDPAELEKLSRLAGELFGAPESPPAQEEANSAPGMLRALLGGASEGGDKAQLIRALSPFLRPERQRRLRRALRMAQAARVALLGMEKLGGGGDV